MKTSHLTSLLKPPSPSPVSTFSNVDYTLYIIEKGDASIRQNFSIPHHQTHHLTCSCSNLRPLPLLGSWILSSLTFSRTSTFVSSPLSVFPSLLNHFHQHINMLYISHLSKRIFLNSRFSSSNYLLSSLPHSNTSQKSWLHSIFIHCSTHSKLPSCHSATEAALRKLTGQERVNSAGWGVQTLWFQRQNWL